MTTWLQLAGHRLSGLEGAERFRRDIAGHLDQAAVDVEEPHAVSATGAGQRPGFADDLDAGRPESLGERVNSGHIRCAEGDHVQSLRVGLPQPDDVRLVDTG